MVEMERRRDMSKWLEGVEHQLEGIRKELHGNNGKGLWDLVHSISERLDKLEKRMTAIFAGIAVLVTVANLLLIFLV